MTSEQKPSSSDDAPQTTSAPAEATGQPWWQNDPQIEAARNEALGWLLSAEERPTLSEEPDPVVMDLYSGTSSRELVAARDDLDRARARYKEAIRAARTAGWSWGEIGRLLGVPRQLLHRRFRDDVD